MRAVAQSRVVARGSSTGHVEPQVIPGPPGVRGPQCASTVLAPVDRAREDRPPHRSPTPGGPVTGSRRWDGGRHGSDGRPLDGAGHIFTLYVASQEPGPPADDPAPGTPVATLGFLLGTEDGPSDP